jgi:hypothetical protein
MAVSRSLFPAVPEWTVADSVVRVVIGTPFVGRRREVDLLRGKLFAPGLGTAQFVSVTGEPGVGKTRLPAEYATLARDGGVAVMSGRAGEFERHVPFGVLPGDGLSTVDTQDVLDAIDVERYRVHRAIRTRLVELAAPDRLTERDLLRPLGTGGVRYRHPLLRSLVYQGIGGGWRFAAHTRAAAALVTSRATATVRAHHVAQSATHGDKASIDTLVEAAVADMNTAPSTAAHWPEAALRLLPRATWPGRRWRPRAESATPRCSRPRSGPACITRASRACSSAGLGSASGLTFT